ncbi:MAG: flavin-containing monooxygenase [Hyphomicrobiaceae bacterium]
MATEHLETLIIGGGQAGLAMSHMLSLRGRPHLVVERGRIAERWRSERWEGLRFQFPNWSVCLPDFPFAHGDPDGFATSVEIVAYLEAYARSVSAPIRCGVAVTRLHRGERNGEFVARTASGVIAADNVVIATGPYQRPVTPRLVADDCDLLQVHANTYQRPEQLPPGAVLIVGSGASGAQIAEELARAGRKVYLSVGRHKRMPRRYRGRDLIWWLAEMGLDRTSVKERKGDAILPLITGAYGGHTIDFRDFAEMGIILTGRLLSGRGSVLEFADDLSDSIAYGDAAFRAFLDLVDGHVARQKIEAPEEAAARVERSNSLCMTNPIRHLDIRYAGLSSVIWATGYTFDWGWIDVPVIDASDAPVHDRGVTEVPGVYFLGLPWLSKMNSSFLSGVGDDAARIADHIQHRMTCAASS